MFSLRTRGSQAVSHWRSGAISASGDDLNSWGVATLQVKVRGTAGGIGRDGDGVEPASGSARSRCGPRAAAVGRSHAGGLSGATFRGIEVAVLSCATFCRARLPGYMVPSTFQFLDALPRTSNGKVDRQKLASMEIPAPEPAEGRAVVRATMLSADCSLSGKMY